MPAPTATLTHCVLLGVAARLMMVSGTAPPLRSERRCPDGSINSFGPCPAPLVPEPAFHVVGPPEVPPPPLARTRITVAPSERGATSLTVKAAGAFHAGDRVRINPGGATEEDNVVARAPFVLATPAAASPAWAWSPTRNTLTVTLKLTTTARPVTARMP